MGTPYVKKDLTEEQRHFINLRNSYQGNWSEQKQKRLVNLLNHKPRLTTSEIAKLLYCTRGAVAGKVYRLQWRGIIK